MAVGCHRSRAASEQVADPVAVAVFADTLRPAARDERGTFTLETPEQRQSLRRLLARERNAWNADKPSDYRFLLRVDCFCPGTRGWLLMDVRGGVLQRAWDRTGKQVSLTDWNTLSVDGLYDMLDRLAANSGRLQIAFDQRWHFPRYVYSSGLRLPDTWSMIEVGGFRPGDGRQ